MVTVETGHLVASLRTLGDACYDVERGFRLLLYGTLVPFVNGIYYKDD